MGREEGNEERGEGKEESEEREEIETVAKRDRSAFII